MVGRGDVSNETTTFGADRSRDNAQGPPPYREGESVVPVGHKWFIEHIREGESVVPVHKSGP